MKAAKRLGMCMILAVFSLFISILMCTPVIAAPKLTLSYLKVVNVTTGVELPIVEPGHNVSSVIADGQEFYFDFNITNTGDSLVDLNMFHVTTITVAASPFTTDVTGFNLGTGETIHYRLKVKFSSKTCSGVYDLKIISPGSITPVDGDDKVNVTFGGGSLCIHLAVPAFNFMPSNPLYLQSNSSYTPKIYGWNITLNNTANIGDPNIQGTLKLFSYNRGWGPDEICEHNISGINIPPKQGAVFVMPVSCPIKTEGNTYFVIYNTAGVAVTESNFYIRRFFINTTVIDYVTPPYLPKLGYLPGENVKIQDSYQVSPWIPPISPLPAGSNYHIWVKPVDTTTGTEGGVIYERYSDPITQLTFTYLGTLDEYMDGLTGPSNDKPAYYLGKNNFSFPSSAPERIRVYREFTDASGNKIYNRNMNYTPLISDIDLLTVVPCNVSYDIGCDCSETVTGDSYEAVCRLKRSASFTNFILNKPYLARFIFKGGVDTSMAMQSITISPDETPTPIYSYSDNIIAFATKVNAGAGTFRNYSFVVKCDADSDNYNHSICGGNDCNDYNASIHPGAAENCTNGIDNDCDGLIGCADSDCAADPSCIACAPPGYVEDNTDCDDTNAGIHLGATEICDDLDNNCDGAIDEGFPDKGSSCSAGIGACNSTGTMVCKADGTGTECDAVPGTPTDEICDGIDNDCDGIIDDGPGALDEDKDGYTSGVCDCDDQNILIHAGEETVCGDGIDNDCDMLPDCLDPDCAYIYPCGTITESSRNFTICHGTDADGDNVCDRYDNCIDIPNPDQADCDNDGYGDLCDFDCSTCAPGVCTLCIRIDHDNFMITQNTLLCPETYYVTDPDRNGVIQFGLSNIYLDCNGAILIAENRCNLPGDVNRNNVLDGQDAFLIMDAVKSNTTFFDPCMDADGDGKVNATDYNYVLNNPDIICSPTGDMNPNGLLDSMDGYIIKQFIEKGIPTKPECTDINGDGRTDMDDYDALFDTLIYPSPSGVKYCDDQVWGDNTLCYGTFFCNRNNVMYYGGDIDYDGKITFSDLLLISLMLGGRLRGDDVCAFDLDSNLFVGAPDLDYISAILGGQYPQYPFNNCAVAGDADGSGYLDGYDLYLIGQKVTSDDSRIRDGYCPCCDVDGNGDIDMGDVNMLSDKLYGRGGVGITIDNKANVLVKNCTLVNYDVGINMTSSIGSTMTKNVFDTASYGIQINEGLSTCNHLGDADGDCVVGVPDLNAITIILNSGPGSYTCDFVPDCRNLDLDGDGTIGITDKNKMDLILSNNPGNVLMPDKLSVVSAAPGVITLRLTGEMSPGNDRPRAGIIVKVEYGKESLFANTVALTDSNGEVTFRAKSNLPSGTQIQFSSLSSALNSLTIIPSVETTVIIP